MTDKFKNPRKKWLIGGVLIRQNWDFEYQISKDGHVIKEGKMTMNEAVDEARKHGDDNVNLK